jgi:hypothetical protein
LSERIDITKLEGFTTVEEAMALNRKERLHLEGIELGLTEEDWSRHGKYLAQKLIDEIKRMYKREDEFLDALRIIRDDLDDSLEPKEDSP